MIHRFVGRIQELTTLDTVCRVPGGPGVVLVEGPAGIGKSRFLTEFARGARTRGLRVINVAATEYEQTSPRQLLLELADHFDGTPGLDARGSAHWLRRQLGSAPTVLVVDDVHWADAPSLRVLTLLLRQLPESTWVVLAYRDEQLPTVFWPALRVCGLEVVRVAIPPLTAGEASALLRGIPSTRRAVLVEAAHGNPLYLQLLAELTPGGLDAAVHADDPAAGPSDHSALDRTIRAELAQLPQRERLVAQAAALCGSAADAELLCATAEVTRREMSLAMDELARRGWVTVTGGTLAFRHPLIRTAAYRLAGPGWRAAAHARAAQVLRAAGAPLLARARHLEHAMFGRDQVAANELLQAAEQALATAPAASVRWIEAALHLAPEWQRSPYPVPVQGRPAPPSVQLLLARAQLLSGAADKARDVLEPLLPQADPVEFARPHEWHAEAVLLYARCERILGRVDCARNLLERAVDQLDDAGSGSVQLELAILELQDNRDDAAAALIRSLFVSGAVRDPAIRAAALTLRSMGQLKRPDLAAARADYRAAEREFAQLTDTQLLEGIHAIAAFGWMAYFLDDQRTGLTHIERAIRVGRRRGRSFILPELHTVHAYCLAKIGRYDDALAAAEDADETAELYGYPGIKPLAGALKLRVLEDTAPRAEVIRWWHILDGLPRPAMRWWRATVEATLTEIAVRLEIPTPAYGPTAGTGRSSARARPTQAVEYAIAALAAVARGDLDAAEPMLAQAEELAERLSLPASRAATARVRAEYLCARGDLDGAQLAVAEAMLAYAQAGMPIFGARVRLIAAHIAGQRGDFAAATAHIAAARAEFTAVGAHELVKAATVAQRRLAGYQTVSGATTLSEREREVAELAARGFSNKDIAARLHLSHRTVEDHLGRILRKLGITGRAGIARRLGVLHDAHPDPDRVQLGP